jgi:hypothetical protein
MQEALLRRPDDPIRERPIARLGKPAIGRRPVVTQEPDPPVKAPEVGRRSDDPIRERAIARGRKRAIGRRPVAIQGPDPAVKTPEATRTLGLHRKGERAKRTARSAGRRRRSSALPPAPAAKSARQAPVVTIFGAGVAGLSVAHELIERGFIVQVVEKQASLDREYECEVGGMARSQFGRIKADPVRLHPYLFPEEAEDYLESVRANEIDDPEVGEILAAPKHKFKDPEARREVIEALQEWRSVQMQPVHRRFGVPERIRFEPSRKAPLDLAREDDHGVANSQKLERVAETLSEAYRVYRTALMKALDDDEVGPSVRGVFEDNPILQRRETLVVEIRGHTDSDGDERENREASLARAKRVRKHLLHLLAEHNPEIPFHLHLVAVTMGSQEPDGNPKTKLGREQSNRVDFQIVEQVVPGEHGYRFFPAYYRHLFDIMRRTPLLDPHRQETSWTAFDQLVTPPPVAIGLEDTRHFRELGRRRPRSFEELRNVLRVIFEEMRITPHDALRYSVQLTKFLTSCPERRQLYEGLSWVEFVDGTREIVPRNEEEPAQIERERSRRDHTKYSKRAEYLLYEVSQALIAMDAEETDAHTHGLTSIQLLLDYLETRNQTDLTLNGPTSLAWLHHWKTYLKRQGVRFFYGAINRLEWNPEHGLVPGVTHPWDEAMPPVPEVGGHEFISHEAGPGGLTPDFYVLAVPFEKASEIIWSYDGSNGNELDGVLGQLRRFDVVSGHTDEKGVDRLRREHDTGKPMGTYPLRDLSGIQYFFPNQVRIGQGHMVFPDTPWGLSSISQPAHWRERRTREGGFLGLLSVDIGDFYEPYPKVGEPAKGERQPTAWNSRPRQIADKTWQQILDSSDKDLADALEKPSYYHLDESIEVDPDSDRPCWNHAPFLINLPGQWEHRAGVSLPALDPQGHRLGPRWLLTGEDSIWYEIANGRWLAAGTHMATLTRLATMEAANESARHAVDAILERLQHARDNKDPDEPFFYNGEGRLLGDYCDLFDPAEHEIEDLKPLKRLDRQLFDQGLPHFLDILGVLELLDKTLEKEAITDRPIANLLKLLEASGRAFYSELPSGHDEVARAVQKLIKLLHAEYASSGGSSDGLLRTIAEKLRES